MPRITRVTKQSRERGRANIFIDGVFELSLDVSVVLKHGLKAGLEVLPGDLAQWSEEDHWPKARARALAYLASRPRSRIEVFKLLQQNGYSGETIESVIWNLEGLGLIDDATFALEFVRGRIRGRGYGPVRLINDLVRRGVEPRLAEQVVHDVEAEEPSAARLRDTIRKLAPRVQSEEDHPWRRRRLMEMVCRRGYSFTEARIAIDELWNEIYTDKPQW